MRIIFSIFFIFIISKNVFAQNMYQELIDKMLPSGDISNLEQQILKEDLRLQTIIIEAIKEVEFSDTSILHIDSAVSNLEKSFTLISEAKAIKFEQKITKDVKEIIHASYNPFKMKDQVLKLNNFLLQYAKKNTRVASSLIRKFGMNVGLFYLMAMQVDYTLPMILMYNGYGFGATLFAIPFSSTSTMSFAYLKSSMKYIHLLRKMGLKDTLQNYKIFKDVADFLHRDFFNSNYVVDLLVDGKRALVTIEEEGFFKRIKQKLGLNKNINWSNLKAILENSEDYSELIRELESETSSDFAKTLKSLQYIESRGDLNILMEISSRYKDSLKFINGLPHTESIKLWAIRAASVKNTSELLDIMRVMPSDIHPRLFNKLWKEFILDKLTTSFGNYLSLDHYRSFRRLIDHFDRDILPHTLGAKENYISQELMTRIDDYLYDSLFLLNACEHPFKFNNKK